MEDFAFSSHDSNPTNIQKSIAACKNHIQHETEYIRSLLLLQCLKFPSPYSLEDLCSKHCHLAFKFVSAWKIAFKHEAKQAFGASCVFGPLTWSQPSVRSQELKSFFVQEIREIWLRCPSWRMNWSVHFSNDNYAITPSSFSSLPT